MSKGLGAVQRALLAAIQEHGSLDTFRACRLAFNIPPRAVDEDGVPFHLISDPQHASARRALAGLEKRGLIVNQGAGWRWGRGRWCTPEYALAHPDEVRARKGAA
jgi:hypothetical protein